MSTHEVLKQFHGLDRTSSQFHKRLSGLLRSEVYRSAVLNLQGENLAWLVGYLENVLMFISNHASPVFQEYLHELKNICSAKEVLPKSHTLSSSLPVITLPPASGRVHEGTSKIRIQHVRVHPGGDPQTFKTAFHQMAAVWKNLAHPNIVPLLGVTTDPVQLVSGWMPDMDLTGYITNHPGTDRLSLLSDVVKGVNYLHSCNVIHRDLRGPKILVDATGHAMITDCGLAMVTQDLDSIRGAPDEYGDSTRWIAPEILDNRGTFSKEADVFSFAMVVIEVFTGAVPFNDKPPRAAVSATISGERPPRPIRPTFTDALWTMTQQCWDQEACRRPQALQILCSLILAWKRSINQPIAIDKRISLVTAIFSNWNVAEAVKCLCRDDAQAFVDTVDEILESLGPQLKRKCVNTLCKICGRHTLLPSLFQIPLCFDQSKRPLCSGGYGDVWVGEYQGCKVAVKVLRVYSTSDFNKITSIFCEEVVTWKTLHHPNVLSLLGVTMEERLFAMVSEWMVNGNIVEFVKAHRDANRFELLEGVVRGLIYMHGEGMIHGDLKGLNILIDHDGRARLADFGLLMIVSDSTYHTSSSTLKSGGTTRWTGPELLDPDRFGRGDGRMTKESDCYALGMVVLEVLSGKPPFPGDSNLIVITKVINGEHPEKPQGKEEVRFTDDLWKILEQCWLPRPERRPAIDAVLQCLERGSTTWQPLPSDSDGHTQSDSDDQLDFTSSHDSSIDSMDWIYPQDDDRTPVPSKIRPRSVYAGQVSHRPALVGQRRLVDLPFGDFGEYNPYSQSQTYAPGQQTRIPPSDQPPSMSPTRSSPLARPPPQGGSGFTPGHHPNLFQGSICLGSGFTPGYPPPTTAPVLHSTHSSNNSGSGFMPKQKPSTNDAFSSSISQVLGDNWDLDENGRRRPPRLSIEGPSPSYVTNSFSNQTSPNLPRPPYLIRRKPVLTHIPETSDDDDEVGLSYLNDDGPSRCFDEKRLSDGGNGLQDDRKVRWGNVRDVDVELEKRYAEDTRRSNSLMRRLVSPARYPKTPSPAYHGRGPSPMPEPYPHVHQPTSVEPTESPTSTDGLQPLPNPNASVEDEGSGQLDERSLNVLAAREISKWQMEMSLPPLSPPSPPFAGGRSVSPRLSFTSEIPPYPARAGLVRSPSTPPPQFLIRELTPSPTQPDDVYNTPPEYLRNSSAPPSPPMTSVPPPPPVPQVTSTSSPSPPTQTTPKKLSAATFRRTGMRGLSRNVNLGGGDKNGDGGPDDAVTPLNLRRKSLPVVPGVSTNSSPSPPTQTTLKKISAAAFRRAGVRGLSSNVNLGGGDENGDEGPDDAVTPLNLRKKSLPAVPGVSTNLLSGPRGPGAARSTSSPFPSLKASGEQPLGSGRTFPSSTSSESRPQESVLGGGDEDFDYISAYLNDYEGRQSVTPNGTTHGGGPGISLPQNGGYESGRFATRLED